MMTRTKRKAVIAVLMILAVALYLISGTYARYTSDYSGTASVDVAVWSVTLKDGEENELEDNFELTFTVEDNDYVVSDKIAPETKATSELHIDLTGTEVAVVLSAELEDNDEALKQIFGDNYNERVTVSAEVEENSSDGYIALINDSAFSGEEAIYTVKITLEWENDEEYNDDDTNAGEQASEEAYKTVKVPIKVTAKQYIDGD